MKEAYFTPESIRACSRRMLKDLERFRQRHASQRFSPRRAALLVLDMQEYFLSPDSHAFIPSAPAILAGIQGLVRQFHTFMRPVILTCHTNTPADAGMIAEWWQDLIAPGSPESRLAAGLDTTLGQVLRKNRYDAFQGAPLLQILQNLAVDQLVITGVMTHLCCETTARSAFGLGFNVFFTVDGTATYNEEFHRSTLLNLAHGFALPVLVSEIASGFEGCDV
ncbi:MAG: isochorismatase family protein [Chloroflexi bacterium]|nr:isochorismatase family protein [Chloroflexota bacterium]